MKLIMEQWREQVISEAAKSETDLESYRDSMKDDKWLRGLWAKYGMWKLGEMLNIGIPDNNRNNWSRFSPEQQKNLISTYWQLMLKKLPPIPCVTVGTQGMQGDMEVSYGAIFPSFVSPARLLRFDSGDRKSDMGDLMAKSGAIKGFPGGSITFHKPENKDGECDGAFIVDSAHQTTQGWGPLLYDIAMEAATVFGGGLTASRNMVSSHAKPIWDYYLSKRVGNGVEGNQMDIIDKQAKMYGLKQLTPQIKSDDCSQKSAIRWSQGDDYGAWEKDGAKNVGSKLRNMSDEERDNVPWAKEALSKRFTKDPNIIKFLGDKGLLHAPQLGYNAIEYHTKDLPPPPEEEPPPEEPLREGIIKVKIR
jgi:hypothetical protein